MVWRLCVWWLDDAWRGKHFVPQPPPPPRWCSYVVYGCVFRARLLGCCVKLTHSFLLPSFPTVDFFFFFFFCAVHAVLQEVLL